MIPVPLAVAMHNQWIGGKGQDFLSCLPRSPSDFPLVLYPSHWPPTPYIYFWRANIDAQLSQVYMWHKLHFHLLGCNIYTSHTISIITPTRQACQKEKRYWYYHACHSTELCNGLCKELFYKNPRLLSGWVGPGLTQDFFGGKSSQNSPKPVLIFWSSIPCVFCLYTLLKVVGF